MTFLHFVLSLNGYLQNTAVKGSCDNPWLWLESPWTGGPGTEHVHVLYKQYKLELNSPSPSSPRTGFKGEVRMDPLGRKSLILQSFQVNRRDFYLDSVENVQQGRSILSLIRVTIRALSLGLTFYWTLQYIFTTLGAHLVRFHCQFKRRGTVWSPWHPLSPRHSHGSKGKAWLLCAAFASHHQNGNLLDQ